MAAKPNTTNANIRCLVAPLAATGLVEDADRAQRVGGQFGDSIGQLPLQEVPHVLVLPTCGGQELLKGSHGGGGFQDDGFDGLSRQVGEQASAIIVKVGGGGALVEEATAVTPNGMGERFMCRFEGQSKPQRAKNDIPERRFREASFNGQDHGNRNR